MLYFLKYFFKIFSLNYYFYESIYFVSMNKRQSYAKFIYI